MVTSPLGVAETPPSIHIPDIQSTMNTPKVDKLTPSFVADRKPPRRILDSDDESCSVVSEGSCSGVSEQKKAKVELPDAVSIKRGEKPLPHPFVPPSNYRPEVELSLTSGNMTRDAKKHFISAIASLLVLSTFGAYNAFNMAYASALKSALLKL